MEDTGIPETYVRSIQGFLFFDLEGNDMAKIKSVTCPNCGAVLTVDEGTNSFFCMYCGSRISIDKSNKVTVTVNVNENSCKTKRIIDEAKIQEIKFQEKKMNNDTGIGFVCLGILLVMSLFFLHIGGVI